MGVNLEGKRKAGNAGLVLTTAGNDLLHTMPVRLVAGPRTARITKIVCYNPGAQATLRFGTLNRNPAGAAFVALLPTLVALAGLDNEWEEEEIPAVEWQSNETPTAAGRTGDIFVISSLANLLMSIEVEEFGA